MKYKLILTHLIILIFHSASSQVNGEFWWLNDKVSKLHSDRVTAPKFEVLSGRETDENDKIVFYENHNAEKIPPDPTTSMRKNMKDSKTWNINFPDFTSNFWWSSGLKQNQIVNETKYKGKIKNNSNKIHIDGDELTFDFSNEVVHLWEPVKSSEFITNKTEITTHATPKETEKSFEEDRTKTLENNGKKINSVESICSFMKAEDCHLRGGNIYNYHRRLDQKSDGVIYPSLTCCVLPLPSKKTGEIVFLESNEKAAQPRYRRSTNSRELDKVLTQRKALIRKNKNSQKIVSSSDDYEDPYANIRVHGSKKSGRPAYSNKYDSGDSDYGDYAAEVPMPGLVGLYSDREPAWYDTSDTSAGEDSVIVDEDSGYNSPILDPRLDVRVATVNDKPRRGKPNKTSSATRFDANSQTITSYHSTPDFKVLQNFKLLNLGNNRNRLQNKDGKKVSNNIGLFTETEGSRLDDNSPESFLNKQFYDKCGTDDKWLEEYEKGSPGGDAPRGSHPHLALLTRKSSRRGLCYATIVHPRAAVTAASCVYGSSPGEVTLHGGIRDLNKDRQGQRRIANFQINPRYSPGDLTYDIAILHWSQPLRLGSNLSPVCVDDPRIGDTCIFLGWGPDAQAISSRPRWQWATVMKTRDCNEPLRGTFCASLEDDQFVGGTGGALVCRREGRTAAVGVAVRRGQDAQVTLLPLVTSTTQLLTSLPIA